MHGNTTPYPIQLLLAVAVDLFSFAREALLSPLEKHSAPHGATRELSLVQSLPPHRSDTLPRLQPDDAASDESITPSTFRTVAEVLETPDRPEKNTIMYSGGQNVPLYQQPTIEFDGILTRIPYGAMIMVLENRGRWSRVGYGTHVGFVLRDELVDRASGVYPDFTIGERNMSDDPNTLKVRACIEDEFGGGAADLPLQASEYVLYKLYRKGKKIAWPTTRPRLAGTWHVILKGAPNVHMSVLPKEGAIIEYTQSNGEGHVAYVETMLLDETISISEANYPEDGIYNERILTREEWRELRPVFIEVG